jgi:DNA repair protein RadC
MSYDMMPSINTPEDVIKAVSFIKNKKREYFMGLYLNARRQLIMTHIISIGTLDMSIAHPREVFEPAIKHNAASVIIVHNHPSGDPEPSNADIVLTRRLVEAGSMLDIQIQDHIILTDKKYISFSKEDYL